MLSQLTEQFRVNGNHYWKAQHSRTKIRKKEYMICSNLLQKSNI